MGYEVTMFYIALSDVSQNIERVAMRVKNGGHSIPTEDILRRNKTSFAHLYDYAEIMDNLVLIDNSEDDGRLLLEVNEGKIIFTVSQLPEWTLPVWEKLKKNSLPEI